MPSVYDADNYAGRVNYAATVITRQGGTTRHFDTCFEMWDGSEVAVALYRRSLRNPRLAANLWRYIGQSSTMAAVERLRDVPTRGLAAVAAETRRQRRQEADAELAVAHPPADLASA
ncbi:hypothetical protein [Aureimonas sp. SK2]|uniref:hypothetical protein n=1 Tax=Aureimonas sp. SK2 TaxID=3015992 RepID=UPI002444D927|nr:hypothetical protein [Aureimonas sp. SK2]